MGKKVTFISIGLICLLFAYTGGGFAQEQPASAQTPKAEEGAVESDILWLWGEVSSIDSQNKNLLVKYFDYETDQEKEMTVAVDNKTILDNIKSFDEIKPQDTVSIDYIVSPDGKSIAKNISIEKPEIAPEPQAAPPQTSTPQVQPSSSAQENATSSEPPAAPTATENNN
ncbi:MAG: hypothetical protein NTU54_03660 [Candidatus Omnitrophica bacterium]|nr:hypothetical protein [Candidatus Omnitrophota bacterium]